MGPPSPSRGKPPPPGEAGSSPSSPELVSTAPDPVLRYGFSVALLGGEEMINSTGTAAKVPHDILSLWGLETPATIDLSEQLVSFVKALRNLQGLKVLAITWSFHRSSNGDYLEPLQSSIES